MANRIFSILGGLVAGAIVIYIVELLSNLVYPAPAGLNPMDPESVKIYIDELPLGAFLFIALAWALGSLAGGFISGIIYPEQRTKFSIAVGVILMLFGLINLLTIPHPVWFWVLGLAVFVPCAYTGALLSKFVG